MCISAVLPERRARSCPRVLRQPASSWPRKSPYWQTATQRTRGCQLDYAIQCRNNTVYVCEIKFSKAPIARSVVMEVDAKIRALGKPRNFTFRPILIHVNGIDDAVDEVGYFDAIIDFGELWQ